MAVNWNQAIEAGHKVASPYIIQGMKKGIEKVNEIVKESGTILDDLIWQDLKDSFQKPTNA